MSSSDKKAGAKHDLKADVSERIALQIRPLLAGQGPDVQGAVLGELVSLWLAGHHRDLRRASFDLWAEMVWNLVPLSEREIFGDSPRPDGWETSN